jgi:hypothetical protein
MPDGYVSEKVSRPDGSPQGRVRDVITRRPGRLWGEVVAVLVAVVATGLLYMTFEFYRA